MAQDPRINAWRALLLASNAALRAIEADMSRAGSIPLTWYDVLIELNAAPDGKLRMQEVGERVVLSRTRVSRLVDEMVSQGLVAKSSDEKDGRVIWAAITDDGRSALKATVPVYFRGIEEHFASHLSQDELELVASALTKVVDKHDAKRTRQISPGHP